MEEKDVYHYTSMDGFYNIINGKSVRVTRSDFMNDSKECSLFYELIEKEDNKVLLRGASDDLKTVIENYSLFDHLKQMEKQMNYYIFSLTKQSDNLPMWYYYGDNGIQLQFKMSELVDLFQDKMKDKGKYGVIEGSVQYVDGNATVADLKKYDYVYHMSDKQSSSFEELLKKINKKCTKIWGTEVERIIYFAKLDLQKSLEYLLEKSGSISTTSSPENIFQEIYNNSKDSKKTKLDFKWEHMLNLIALSALTKTNSYANEDEYRIVLVNEELSSVNDEDYYMNSVNRSSILKPCLMIQEMNIGDILENVTLSPITKNLPISENEYKRVVQYFLKKECHGKEIEVKFSQHSIRW